MRSKTIRIAGVEVTHRVYANKKSMKSAIRNFKRSGSLTGANTFQNKDDMNMGTVAYVLTKIAYALWQRDCDISLEALMQELTLKYWRWYLR